MKCPECGFDNPGGLKYCGMCGTRLTRVCSACSFANPLEFRFCGQCGTRLGQEPSLEQAAKPQRAVEGSDVPPPGEASSPPYLPSVPPQPSMELQGERRPATVVVADVTDSTDILERLGSESWVEIMDRVLQILETEVYRLGGEVDQFRGDGLVAFFGARLAHEDDPERAVLAGLAMHEALDHRAQELAGRENIDLSLRVGVNTGEVIVTSVGDRRQHSEDTAMGEAVALAARMEEAAEPGTVLVSENTYRLAESDFEWDSLGRIKVKGISQPIATYRPLEPLAGTEHLHSLQAGRPSTTLIGRDDEFQRLRGRVEGLCDGRGGIVTVTGERGLGKSFLVSEVRHHFSRHGALMSEACKEDTALSPVSLTWLRGRCRSYDQSWPYSMWLDLLRRWLGMREREPREEMRDRLRSRAEQLWGDRLAEFYPYLATSLSLPLEKEFTERVKHLDAQGLRHQVFRAVRHLVEAMAQREPLVVAFEDVHWADTTSLDLLKYCLPLCDQESLLWLLVSRPDRASPMWEFSHYVETQYPHRLTSIALSPLTDAESGQFIDQLIGPEALPVETQALIIGKAEGNPYYIEELVQALVSDGVLTRDPQTGEWRATRTVTSLDIPDGLQSLLLARIDSLSLDERGVLKRAAVIGSVFWSKVVQHLTGDEIPASEHLTSLQRAQLVQERGQVAKLGMEYVFKSNLIRDAAYESILSTQRAAYHLEIAEYIEQLFGQDILPQHYGVLAYHYKQAGKSEKELSYTIQAAERAREIYANAEARKHYTRALKLLNEMEAAATDESRLHTIHTKRFEVLDGRREILHLMGDLDAERADAEALLELARQLDDRTWLIDALLQQPGVATWQSREEVESGESMAEEALALSQQLEDRHREMRSLLAISNQRLLLSDPTWLEMAEQALELARRSGDQRYEARILTHIGTAYAWSDQPQRGTEYLTKALPITQMLGDRITEVQLLNQISLQSERSGDYYRVLTEYHERRLRISRDIGYRPGESDALISCGQTRGIYLGDYEAGMASLEEGRRIRESIARRVFGSHTDLASLLRIVQILTMRGEHDEALKTLEGIQNLDEEETHEIIRAGLRLVSAIVYNALGDEEHLTRALELATQTRQLVSETPLTGQYKMASACEATAAHLGLAKVLDDERKRRAHRRQALKSSRAALEIYRDFGFVQIIECLSEEILYRHSLALAANDRQSEAATYLQRAYDEMMRKYDLIPTESHFRRTYLESIPLHRDIRTAYAAGSSGARSDVV